MDPKELALEHFEKAVAGFALIILLYIGATMGSDPPELKQAGQLNTQMATIDRYMNNPKTEKPPPPTWVEDLNTRLDPTKVDKTVDSFPGWMMHRRPGFLFYLPPPEKKHEARHYRPKDLAGDGGTRGEITLKWRRDSKRNRLIQIKEYIIERKVGEDGEWNEVGRVNGEDEQAFATWPDKSLESRKEYFYRVTSVATIDHGSDIVDREGTTLDPAEARKTVEFPGSFTTKRDVFIIPTQPTITTKPCLSAEVALEIYKKSTDIEMFGRTWDIDKFPKRGFTALYVYKWDNISGKFVRFKYKKVREKQVIGSLEEKVKIDGKRRKEFDFSTNARLVQVRVNVVQRMRDGKPVGRPKEHMVITYQFGTKTEKNGKTVWKWEKKIHTQSGEKAKWPAEIRGKK